MTEFAEDDLTRDAFLGGALQIWQPRGGYRAGIDPVVLASAVPARAGQSVLELGCGAGTAMFCLATRVPGVQVTGVEVQPEYGALARRNSAENHIEAAVFSADLADLPDPVRQARFDHVIANPPYFRAGAHSPSVDAGRQVALGEVTPLSSWIDIAARRLAPKGYLHVIQRVDRLPDLLAACAGRIGSIEVLPLCPRVGRAADLMLLRGRKSGRAAFRLLAPAFVHQGDAERAYSPEIEAILRHGAALDWPA